MMTLPLSLAHDHLQWRSQNVVLMLVMLKLLLLLMPVMVRLDVEHWQTGREDEHQEQWPPRVPPLGYPLLQQRQVWQVEMVYVEWVEAAWQELEEQQQQAAWEPMQGWQVSKRVWRSHPPPMHDVPVACVWPLLQVWMQELDRV